MSTLRPVLAERELAWSATRVGSAEQAANPQADGPFQLLALGLVETLLDQLPQAPYFIKDESLRYVSANAAMLDLCGVKNRSDLVGRTAREFFSEAARRRYEALERVVMRTQRPVRDQLDFSVRKRGSPVWLLLGIWPIVDLQGRSLGVVGIARRLEATDRRRPEYDRLAVAVEHIQTNFGAPLDVTALARRAGTSVSRLERDFVSLFGLPPRRYLTKVRLDAAMSMLLSDDPIVDIAHACGYADQSSFTRAFRRAAGMSPTEYRRAYAAQGRRFELASDFGAQQAAE